MTQDKRSCLTVHEIGLYFNSERVGDRLREIQKICDRRHFLQRDPVKLTVHSVGDQTAPEQRLATMLEIFNPYPYVCSDLPWSKRRYGV